MKKLLVLLMATFALCAISCSDDDFGVDKGGVQSSYPSVIGTWADIDKNADGEFGLSWTFGLNGQKETCERG